MIANCILGVTIRSKVSGSFQVESSSHTHRKKYAKQLYGCQPKNRGFYPPKSCILIGFSIINHPFWGFSLFLETPIWVVFVGNLERLLLYLHDFAIRCKGAIPTLQFGHPAESTAYPSEKTAIIACFSKLPFRILIWSNSQIFWNSNGG